MNNPRVSIIIPCYNYGRFVKVAITSALNQDYKNLEVIVVNDGSTDNSDSIIKQFEDKIIYIKQDNRGVSKARNSGILKSTGEYCICLDADDYISPDFVSDAVKVADENTIVCPIAYATDKNLRLTGGAWPDKYTMKTNGNTFRDFLICDRTVSTSMFPKKKWEMAGGFEPGVLAEDYIFWLELSKLGCKMKYLDPKKIHLKYRRHGSSITDKINHDEAIEFIYRRYNIFKESFSREEKIKAMYNLILERDPYISEIEYHNRIKLPLRSITLGIMRSKEYRLKFNID